MGTFSTPLQNGSSRPPISEETQQSPTPTAAPSPRALRRLVLRQRLLSLLSSLGPLLPPLLILLSLTLFLCLPTPTPPIAKRTYVDENALQPASANVYWEWDDVGLCDELAREIREEVQWKSEMDRAKWVRGKLIGFGLDPHEQEWAFALPGGRSKEGANAYARWWSPRGDGREAMVISASWESRWDGSDDPDASSDSNDSGSPRPEGPRINVRGVATVLGLARHLTTHARSHWSKDLIFLISSGHLEGAHAFTQAYYGLTSPNLRRDEVQAAQGAMLWNAVGVDYPSDSFESLAVLHTGIDGQVPNLDVVNTLGRVADIMGRVPVRLPGTDVDFKDAIDGEHGGGWGWLGRLLEDELHWGWRGVAKYRKAALNILSQLGGLAASFPEGPHALLLRHHVDAITLYATPARGPYGFWHMGRILVSQVTSYSNLIERLHHSQFFYLLGIGPDWFVQLGIYLPVALLVSVALTLAGIGRWSAEGRRARLDALSRPVGTALLAMVACHLVGYVALMVFTSSDVYAAGGSLGVMQRQAAQFNSILVGGAFLVLAATTLMGGSDAPSPWQRRTRRVGHLVHAFTLLHAGAIIAVLSVLNWSAAVVLGFLIMGPLYLLPVSKADGDTRQLRRWGTAVLALVAIFALLPWNLALLLDIITKRYGSSLYFSQLLSWPLRFDVEYLLTKAWYQHHILATSCLPLVAMAYTPLLIQAGLALVLTAV
ncbi:hypothetical protein BDZ90DRAFT_256130 [Jaminaea rosea]|uniref:Gaa1-domain-containing protein n=1 Tax=Jaminaea rosea TaxID=1569628 RepID=A0A316UI15_9BASI|nr:hypothetical protein BDZ90DRAFT_256130 [Jaminaea rosea]PWN24912.1 hypothetical protein BDZ90DRAFT_256130 [Jaminaea rosea]